MGDYSLKMWQIAYDKDKLTDISLIQVKYHYDYDYEYGCILIVATILICISFTQLPYLI
jgi:hypothetical protein